MLKGQVQWKWKQVSRGFLIYMPKEVKGLPRPPHPLPPSSLWAPLLARRLLGPALRVPPCNVTAIPCQISASNSIFTLPTGPLSFFRGITTEDYPDCPSVPPLSTHLLGPHLRAPALLWSWLPTQKLPREPLGPSWVPGTLGSSRKAFKVRCHNVLRRTRSWG